MEFRCFPEETGHECLEYLKWGVPWLIEKWLIKTQPDVDGSGRLSGGWMETIKVCSHEPEHGKTRLMGMDASRVKEAV